MILKGNQRAGGTQLAIHLMNVQDNEHVTVHELRGFLSDDLHGAFNEAYAVSRGTKCRQFLFSLSLNPPEMENVPVDVFEAAIADIEEKLCLTDQPRAIVFHEKEGRRHAHCVWSRINVDEMKAINLSHYKLKLRDISRELYLEHQWKMPRGLANAQECDPLNFSLEEWQQAKRLKVDPRKIRRALQDAWAFSDSLSAFEQALQERGFRLAQGDRRGHVAVDFNGSVFAISRAVGLRAKDIRAKLGQSDDLKPISEVQMEIAKAATDKLMAFAQDETYKLQAIDKVIEAQRHRLVHAQRRRRDTLVAAQRTRKKAETKKRSSRLPRGLKALWFRITGAYRKIKAQNESEYSKCENRDRREREALVQAQLSERRELRTRAQRQRQLHADRLKDIFAEIELRQSQLANTTSDNKAQRRKRRQSPKRTRAP